MIANPLRAAPVAALFLAACAQAAPPAGSPSGGGAVSSSAETVAADTTRRAEPRPVPVPAAFTRAVQRGTRTATGQPGARYWQNRVRYRIEAEVDPARPEVRGRETVVLHNRSPDAMPVVMLNLYQNLFTGQFTQTGGPMDTGGMRLERVAAQGQTLAEIPESRWSLTRTDQPLPSAGYQVQGTMGAVVLPRPLAPGDSATFEISWRFRVPPEGAPRNGYEDALGGRVLQVAQWYPQIAVYDDVVGTDRTPYTGNGEFYLEYGDFDVSLTLPAGWLVGASGTLRNAGEVLTPQARQRLEAALRSDEVTHVVTEAEIRGRTATLPGQGGRITWRFEARDVRDFAFATSNRYVWDATRATIPAAEGGGTRVVAVNSFYRPRAPHWERAWRYAQHSTRHLSEVLPPYLYPQITVAEGPIYGMEYPMIVFIGRTGEAQGLYTVIAHEVGHEWFPMMVGQDEAAFAWMDEGVTTYHEALAVRDFYPGEDPWAGNRSAYLVVAGRKTEVPLMRHTDLSSEAAGGVAAYYKPGTLLRSLREVVGDSVFDVAMRTYTREWMLKHPYPWDFFNTVERVSGRDLDWFFEPWWFRTATLDHAIEGVVRESGSVRVTVRDVGTAPAPARIAVITTGGDTTRATIPAERWTRDRLTAVTVTVPVRGTVSRVELDPEQIFPDANRRNNVWRGN